MRDFWMHFLPDTTPATTPISEHFWNYFSQGDELLEVGTAWGRVVYECLNRGLRITGVDINTAEIYNLQQRLKEDGIIEDTKLALASATNLPFKSENFEGVFLQGLLSALPIKERLTSLKETYRVLKHGGYVHIAEFELNNTDPDVMARYNRDLQLTGEYGTVSVTNGNGRELFWSHNFRSDELANLVQSARLEIIDISKKAFPTFKGKEKPGIILQAQKK